MENNRIEVEDLRDLGKSNKELLAALQEIKENNTRLIAKNVQITADESIREDVINAILVDVFKFLVEENEKIIGRGRPTAQKPENWNEVIALWESKQITGVEAMKRLNITKTTFYKLYNLEKGEK